jgi:hypothetical protein
MDLEAGTVHNRDTGDKIQVGRYPDFILTILRYGGVIPSLQRQGLLKKS